MRHSIRRVSSFGLAGVFIAAVSGCSGTISMLRAFGAVHRLGSDRTEGQARQGRHDSAKILVLSFASTDLRLGQRLGGRRDHGDDFRRNLEGFAVQSHSRTQGSGVEGPQPRWSTKSPQDIGEEFEVDYVVTLEVTDFAVQEPKSPFLLQGRAKASIKVPTTSKRTRSLPRHLHAGNSRRPADPGERHLLAGRLSRSSS